MFLFMLQQLNYIWNFFFQINSNSSDLINYYTLTIEFLALKYYTNFLFYQFFLPHLDFFFSLIPSVASFFFFFPSHSLILSIAVASFFLINQMKLEKIKEKKKKKEKKERDLFMKKRTNPNTNHKTKSNS